MLELTPLKPYSQYVDTLKTIERNMKERRLEIAKILNPNEHVLVMPHFPLLGVGDFLFPPPSSNNEASQSIYLSDDIISPFPRFKFVHGYVVFHEWICVVNVLVNDEW